MKKDLTILIKILFALIIFLPQKAVAEIFLMPDWNFYNYRENTKITKNANETKYEKIRNNYKFCNYFDKQTIILHKKIPNVTPQNVGRTYFARTLLGDTTFENYILRDEPNYFLGIYCSKKLQRCEIERVSMGFDGIVESRYTHNNLWHFQNNIGSFLETQTRIKILPNFIFKNYIHRKYILRLEK